MSDGAAGTSSRAPEPGDDESDRDEDQDEQPSFVCDLLAGRVGGSLRLDDDADDDDADDAVAQPDATPMSPTWFLPAHSQTPSKLGQRAVSVAQRRRNSGQHSLRTTMAKKKKLSRVFFNLQTKVFISLYRPNSGWGIGTPRQPDSKQKPLSISAKRDLVSVSKET